MSRTDVAPGLEALPSADQLPDDLATLKSMILELKRSKGYVDDIIHFMADSLIVVDQERKISSVNPAACSLLGYEREKLMGQPIGQIIYDIELWDFFMSLLFSVLHSCLAMNSSYD